MRKVLFIFGQLTDADVLWLARNGRRRRVERGSALIHEGVSVDTLYILLEGELDVVVGPELRRLAQLLPGEVVGEMSFIDRRPPSATVRAATDSVVCAVPKARLQEALSRDAAFAARFYKAIATFLSDRLRHATSGGDGLATAPRRPEADELDDNVLDNLDRAGARFDELGRQLLDG
jgi:CRP-like cAMP-binding protein